MSAAQLPVHYHDVVGVAVIIGDQGFQPQEVFRYPFFNEDPSLRPLGHFDRIPPEILTKLLKTTGSDLSGELLEMVFDDVRLISRPVQLSPERTDKEWTAADFFNLVLVVSSEYYPRRQLYPTSRLPKKPHKKKTPPPLSAVGVNGGELAGAGAGVGETAAGAGAATRPAGPGDDSAETAGAYPPAEGHGDGEWGEIEFEGSGGVEEEGGDEGGGVWEEEAGGGDEEERDHGVDLALLRGAVMMVSRAMRHEEWKNGFISESGKHLQNKKRTRACDMESFMSNMINMPLDNGSGVYMNFGGRLYGGARQYSPGEMKARGVERWQESVMDESQLARDMRTLYEGLTSGRPFEMTIKRSSGLSINVTVQREVPAARRFETLLLREQKHIALAGHPKDGSPQIRRLIQMADPHKTLEELAYTSEIELSQMLRLARHMVFWGDGRVIDTLCASNRYQVTREAMKANIPSSPLLAEFRGRFPRRNLMRELTRFGKTLPLSEILEQSKKSSHESLIAVLTFLLRRDLLVQVQRFVTLAIPEPHPESYTDTDGDTDGDSDSDEDGEGSDDGHHTHKHAGGSGWSFAAREGSGRGAVSGTGAGGAGNGETSSDVVAPAPAPAPASEATDEAGDVGRSGGGCSGGDANDDSGGTPGSSTSAVAAVAGGGNRSGSSGVGVGGGGEVASGGPFSGSVVGYAVDAAGNTWFEAPTLQPFEEEYLQAADDGSEASKLMRRLAPLFRGKLSLREIVWRLEITSMPFLELVLSRYADVLHEVWRPARDPVS
eukprot:g10503.t1